MRCRRRSYDKGVRAGDVKYWDRNGDGNITDDDRIVTGNPNPKFSGGWNNTFKYKRAGIEPLLYVQLRKRRVCVVDDPRLQARPYPLAAESPMPTTAGRDPARPDKYPRAIYSYSGWNG